MRGSGGIGLPAGPAAAAAQARAGGGGANARGGGGGGRNGGGGGARGGDQAAPGSGGQTPLNQLPNANSPGLMTATFPGGYVMSLWSADVATGEGKEVWHPAPTERRLNNLNNPLRAGNYIVFSLGAAGGGRGGGGGRGAGNPDAAPAGPPDEWDRYYSLDTSNPMAAPVLLTTTDGMIETNTDYALSSDGKMFYYCTNAIGSNPLDRELRHIWAVPVAGGTPKQVTGGGGIETYPAPLASGKGVAVLAASWNMPMSLGLWKMTAPDALGTQTIVFPTSRPGFPVDAHVQPELVITHPADNAFEIHNQLFLPKDIKPGEKRPAMVFVHGGPVREMLLGYHYRYVYHQFYGMNEWLAAHGYVVLSINYRSGVGYGAVVPLRAEHRSARQLRIPGRRRRREVSAVAAGCRREAHRHLRAVVRRAAHGAGAGAQLGHLLGAASTTRACICTAARSIRTISRTSRRRFPASTSGRRRCSSSRATTTAT